MNTENAFLDPQRWSEVFKDQWLVDVAIRAPNILQFCTRQKMDHQEASLLLDDQIPVRIISLFLDLPAGKNCGFQELEGMAFPVLGVSRAPFERPSGMVTGRNRDGDTWPVGNGNGPMEHIAPGQWPGIERLKCINGITYAVGRDRNIFQRVADGRWERFASDGLTCAHHIPGIDAVSTSRMLDITSQLGFSDLCAFPDSDMYAVGGRGDVWRFNGSEWLQMGFPSNVQLRTVTCAGDGNVYISGEGGSLWVGEKSTWKRLYQGSSSVLWNDAIWYQDQLWLASDHQFRTWRQGSLHEVTHDGQNVNMYGHMDCLGNLLAIASPEWVKTFDGAQWKTIVQPVLD